MVANYITKLRGLKLFCIFFAQSVKGSSCKLYHKTTWFETVSIPEKSSRLLLLQIISQNYVVWNKKEKRILKAFKVLQIISQNYVVWNIAELPKTKKITLKLQIISQNYVVWNRELNWNPLPIFTEIRPKTQAKISHS